MVEARFLIAQLTPLPEDIKTAHNIIEIPSPLYIDDKEYADNNVPFSIEEMCRFMLDGTRKVGSAQSGPQDYIDVINRIPANIPVFQFVLSSKLSAYYKSAVTAREQLADRDITVVDTRCTPPVMALMAIEAAKLAREASSVDDLKAKIRNLLPQMGQFWAFHSLKYLYMSGRINAAQAFIGKMIQLVPIVTPNADGELISAAKTRRIDRAFAKIAELITADIAKKNGSRINALVLHTGMAREEGELLEKTIKERLPVESTMLLQASYVTHRIVGPKAVSVAYRVS